mgnify:CR=1 FL=1
MWGVPDPPPAPQHHFNAPLRAASTPSARSHSHSHSGSFSGLPAGPCQASCYGTDTEKDEGYMEALSQLHTYWANKLLEVGRRGGW